MKNEDTKRYAAMRRRAAFKKEVRLLPGYILVIGWTVFTFLLLGWVFCASLSTTPEIFNGNTGKFLSGLHFENYSKAWKSQNVSVIFFNSLGYALISSFMLILICAPAAYALSRYTFLGNRLCKSGLAAAMGVPMAMIVLPLFCLAAGMGLIDSGLKNRMVLIFLYIGVNVPYTTIFLMTFFSTLSKEYEEAAAIDGCSIPKAFWKIMFPLAQSGIVTVTIFNFVQIWGEYFLSLIFANTDKLRSVSVGLFSMVNSMRYTGDWAGLFASVVIVMLPTLILYIFLSEKIIAGITVGGVKG